MEQHLVLVCKFGKGCKKGGICAGAHPEAGKEAVDCKYKGGCTKRGTCQGAHPKVCKDGEECKRDDCFFTHPKGKVAIKEKKEVAPCRDGDSCKRKDNGCWFKH